MSVVISETIGETKTTKGDEVSVTALTNNLSGALDSVIRIVGAGRWIELTQVETGVLRDLLLKAEITVAAQRGNKIFREE